jgi:hypothetical protein
MQGVGGNFEDAIDLVGYLSDNRKQGRVWVRWFDRGVVVNPAARMATMKFKRLGQTECIDRREAERLIEAMTGRKPGRKGGSKPRERTYEQMLLAARGDFPQSGAKINSIVRRATVVHPMQARIMETLNIIRDKGEVKHGGASLSECMAAAFLVVACKRRGFPCDKEPIILIGRKRWHDGFIADLEALGVEYERVHA